MKYPLHLFAFFTLLSTFVHAADLDDKMKVLQKTGEDFAAAASLGNASESMRALSGEWREFSNNIGSLQSYLENNQFTDATRNIRRWLTRTKNEEIKKALTQLLESIEAEEKAAFEKLEKRVAEEFGKAAGAVKTSTNPDDIHAAREALEDFRNYELNVSGRTYQKLQNRVYRVTNFLSNWATFVGYEAEGDFYQAYQTINNLKRSGGYTDLITSAALDARRADVFKKAYEAGSKPGSDSSFDQATAAAMEKVRTPQDARAAAQSLMFLTEISSGRQNRTANALRNQLENLARMQENFDDGNYARVISDTASERQTTPYDDLLQGMQVALKIRAIEAANDIEKLGSPAKGQSLGAFLKDAAKQAFEKKDWPRLHVLLSVHSSITGGGCTRSSSMQEGVRALLAAQELEKAGLFREAISQYTQGISQIGPFVPRAAATEALARLRQDQPAAFEPATK